MKARLCRCSAWQGSACGVLPSTRSATTCGVLLLAMLAATAAGPIGDGRVDARAKGRKDIEDFRFLSTGACTINEHAVHKYGATLAASDTIMAVGGDDGTADVQCISVSCNYVDSLQFWWSDAIQRNSSSSLRSSSSSSSSRQEQHAAQAQAQAQEQEEEEREQEEEEGARVRGISSARRPPSSSSSSKGGAVQGMPFISHPLCERGAWRPEGPSPVQVAVKDSTVAFAAAGCVEVSALAEHAGWQHIVSLPASLSLSCAPLQPAPAPPPPCGTILPAKFGTAMALEDGVLLAAARAAMTGGGGGGGGGEGEEPVVIAFTRLGAAWQQTDVLRCPDCSCPPGEVAELGGDGCFGAAVAVHDDLAVVGYPRNSSVLVFRRELRSVPGKSGLVVAWRRASVLSSSLAPSLFGASLALGASLLVVGFPADINSGAFLFRIDKPPAPPSHGGAGLSAPAEGAPLPLEVAFELVLDTRDRCCDIGLPCCDSSHVGASVALSEFAHYDTSSQATIAVGDAFSSQVHAFTCNLTKLHAALPHACTMSAAILPGYERESRGDAKWGFGSKVAMGGQAVLVADAADGCGGMGRGGGCGTVCEVAACAPGHCLMYDFSTDTDFCQACADPSKCPGGIRSCVDGEGGTMWAMLLSTGLFVLLFCCLYSLSAWARGAGVLEVVLEVLCCGLCVHVPGHGFVFAPGHAGEEALLSRAARRRAEEEAAAEDDSDEDESGYVPPVVREAFGLAPRHPSSAPAPASGGGGGGGGGGGSEGARGGDEAGEEGGEEEGGEEGGEKEGREEEEGGGGAEKASSMQGEKGDDKTEEGEAGPGAGEGEGGEGEGGRRVEVGLNYFACKVCFERPIQTVLVPCGHEALCGKCSRRMKTCPICRKVVQKVQPVLQS